MFPTAPKLAQHHIQTAVIGAGVIGLSIARSLACQNNHEVLIIEQSTSIGSGISSRNSEVIHAGIYYDRNKMPLKAKLCVEGKNMLYTYCKERHVPYRQCGKLIVASDEQQRDTELPKLVEYAKLNGVDLQILSKEEVSSMEPNVASEGAVYSPSTGIVNSHALMTSLLSDAEECGAMLALRCRVEGGHVIQPANNGTSTIVLNVDETEISCDNVIVCAGLASDKIASSILSSSLSHNNTALRETQQPIIPRQYYAKGNYFKLENQRSPFTRLVYPLPDSKGGLGVHATIDMSGNTRFGPDVQWLDPDITKDTTDNPYEVDMNVDPNRATAFYDAIRKYWPGLKDGNIVPDYAGVRPKLSHPQMRNVNSELGDFVIAGEKDHGVRGLLVLLGIESPGLTSSLAIAELIAKMMK
jgi:L-2-hydroxyglutarate oxidase LhgO